MRSTPCPATMRRTVNVLVAPRPLIWMTVPVKRCGRSFLPSTILYITSTSSPTTNGASLVSSLLRLDCSAAVISGWIIGAFLRRRGPMNAGNGGGDLRSLREGGLRENGSPL